MCRSDLDATQAAIDFEKDSILLYGETVHGEMQRFVPDEAHKVMAGVLGVERKHLARLSELKLSLRW